MINHQLTTKMENATHNKFDIALSNDSVKSDQGKKANGQAKDGKRTSVALELQNSTKKLEEHK